MAIKKYRLQRLVEGAETPDTVHLETSSDLVMQPDGTSLADGILDLKIRNSISMNRKPDTAVGKVSIAIGGMYSGQEAEANDYGTFAFGAMAKATGAWSMALGSRCETDSGVVVGNGSKTNTGNAFGDSCRSTKGLAIGTSCINNSFYGLVAGYRSAVLRGGYYCAPVSSYDAGTKTLTCEDPYASFPGSFTKVEISAGDEVAVIFEKTAAAISTGGAEIKFCNVVSIDYDAKTITVDNLSVPTNSKPLLVTPTLPEMTNVGGEGGVACGTNCISYGNGALAMGIHGVATTMGSVAIGCDVRSDRIGLLACGLRNLESSDNADRLIVGGGSSNKIDRSNCFRVTTTGVYAAGNYNASGADYAEMFEWVDGNPDGRDYVGHFVTLNGDKLKLATSTDDFILGVVSGNPSIVGDVHDDQWQGMYMYDIYGRPLFETITIPEWSEEVPDNPRDPDSHTHIVTHPERTETCRKLNPEYNNQEKYLPRTSRPEWATVGLMGKLVVNDDGTSVPNGYVKVNDDSIATASAERTKFRVMKRLDDSHIQILILG